MTVAQAMSVRFADQGHRLSMNDRVGWRRSWRIGQGWKNAAHIAAVAQMGAGPAARRREPCFVRVAFPVPDPGRRRDPHNLAPTVKAIVDGLVLAGVWPDDNERWVSVLDPRFYKPDRNPRHVTADVIVTLSPRAGGFPE